MPGGDRSEVWCWANVRQLHAGSGLADLCRRSSQPAALLAASDRRRWTGCQSQVAPGGLEGARVHVQAGERFIADADANWVAKRIRREAAFGFQPVVVAEWQHARRRDRFIRGRTSFQCPREPVARWRMASHPDSNSCTKNLNQSHFHMATVKCGGKMPTTSTEVMIRKRTARSTKATRLRRAECLAAWETP